MFTRYISVLALVALGTTCRQGLAKQHMRPNIVLVTIDTLRADHVGAYGYRRPTSPFIDRLAASGLLFERAVAAAPWTLPSMASVHTSLFPTDHGAVGSRASLRDDVTTLAEALQGAGYDTIGFVTASFLSRRFGFAQGFDTFDESLTGSADAVTSDELTEHALGHLGESRREPFFLWVHYFDPHSNYIRHADFGFVEADPAPDRIGFGQLRLMERAFKNDDAPRPFSVETVQAVYDEEIAFTDAAIGRLVEGLERLELKRPIVIALTSDHGEAFLDHGRFGHGRDVYDPLIHVPLILTGDIDPSLRGRRSRDPVETASLASTLARVGQVTDNPFRGSDLLAPAPAFPPVVFSYGCQAWDSGDRKIMAESEGWKLIRNLDDDSFELYDLRHDPRELENLWDRKGAEAAAAANALRAAMDGVAVQPVESPAPFELTPEETERLKSLGYVQ